VPCCCQLLLFPSSSNNNNNKSHKNSSSYCGQTIWTWHTKKATATTETETSASVAAMRWSNLIMQPASGSGRWEVGASERWRELEKEMEMERAAVERQPRDWDCELGLVCDLPADCKISDLRAWLRDKMQSVVDPGTQAMLDTIRLFLWGKEMVKSHHAFIICQYIKLTIKRLWVASRKLASKSHKGQSSTESSTELESESFAPPNSKGLPAASDDCVWNTIIILFQLKWSSWWEN